MPVIHLVYPRDPARHHSPFCIGNELGDRLLRHHDVRFHDWKARETIVPRPGDVLIGHPHWRRDSVFSRSVRQPGFARRILMAPYADDIRQVAYFDRHADDCDLMLVITGGHWFNHRETGVGARWAPKMRHLDLAVDRDRFPFVKTRFNPPGQRRFVYIGNTARIKNVGYLAAIHRACPEAHIQWIGKGRKPIPGVPALGFADFSTPGGRAMLDGFDFMITVGGLDANPTTILESMSWGLIPVCTPTSGYENEPGIVNVPLDDVAGAKAVIDRLQAAPEAELLALQAEGQRRLTEHYHWDRFAADVEAAIASPDSPALRRPTASEWLRMRAYDLIH